MLTFGEPGSSSWMQTSGAEATRVGFFIGAAICVQLRLLCNLIDGMIAVEGNMQSKVGMIYNELPDRVADTIFLVSAGYASQAGRIGIELGWAASVLAIATAYIRAFGAAQGLGHDFCGPMAKQHRMFVLTVCCLLAAAEIAVGWQARALAVGLAAIAAGTLVTCVRRTWHMASALEKGKP